MICIFLIFLYIVIGTIVAIGMAKSDHEEVLEASHPGYFFAGVFWPLVVPILLGSKIAHKIFRVLVLAILFVSCGPSNKEIVEEGHQHIYKITIESPTSSLIKEGCDFWVNKESTMIEIYCHGDKLYAESSSKFRVIVERKTEQ